MTPEEKFAQGYSMSGSEEGQALMQEAQHEAWHEGRELNLEPPIPPQPPANVVHDTSGGEYSADGHPLAWGEY